MENCGFAVIAGTAMIILNSQFSILNLFVLRTVLCHITVNPPVFHCLIVMYMLRTELSVFLQEEFYA